VRFNHEAFCDAFSHAPAAQRSGRRERDERRRRGEYDREGERALLRRGRERDAAEENSECRDGEMDWRKGWRCRAVIFPARWR
jgi:hypothetical protein